MHRDIKGANILTTFNGTNGVIKLTDFGVATHVSDNDDKSLSCVGTPYWMAPEAIDIGKSQLTSTDVHSPPPPFLSLQTPVDISQRAATFGHLGARLLSYSLVIHLITMAIASTRSLAWSQNHTHHCRKISPRNARTSLCSASTKNHRYEQTRRVRRRDGIM